MNCKRPEDEHPDAHQIALQMASVNMVGWNIRCNHCGKFGAAWIPAGRVSLALCPEHCAEWEAEQQRHAAEISRLAKINFEQPACADMAASMVMSAAWRNRHMAGEAGRTGR
jgi:hypothetical protein